MDLSGSETEKLWRALLDAFDLGSLQRMLSFEMNVNLLEIVPSNSNMSEIVFELIQWSRAQGRTAELIRSAYQARPNNPNIAEFFEEHCSGSDEAGASAETEETTVLIEPPIFNHQEILAIHSLLTRSHLMTEVDTLQSGMNLDFRLSLPASGPPSSRVLSTLHILNSTGQLADGEIPLEIFLSTAVHLSKARPESKELKAYLDRIRPG